MPRRSIRTIAQILLGLTTDDPAATPALGDEIGLVERLGDSRLSVVPAFRPRLGGGTIATPTAAAVFSVGQVRAGPRPIYVLFFTSTVGAGSVRWRVGADLIDANRAGGQQWLHPQGSAIVEGGTTVAGQNAVTQRLEVASDPLKFEAYLEPGEVLSLHHITANTQFVAGFNWHEVP